MIQLGRGDSYKKQIQTEIMAVGLMEMIKLTFDVEAI